MKNEKKYYRSKRTEQRICVVPTTKKFIMEALTEALDWTFGFGSGPGDDNGDVFEILYNDGTRIFVDRDFSGKGIKRSAIASIIWQTEDAAYVYGHYEIDYLGEIAASFETIIDDDIIQAEPWEGGR